MNLKTIGQFFAEVQQDCLEANKRHFLPIWAEAKIGKKIVPVGTVTLIALNDKKYAITATHCFSNKEDYKYLLGGIGKEAYYIDVDHFHDLTDYQNLDISFAVWNNLGVNVSDELFLDASNIIWKVITHFSLLGYPSSKGKYLKKNIRSQLLNYGGAIFTQYSTQQNETKILTKLEKDYTQHIFFHYEDKVSDGVTHYLNAPELRGMSGGGFFGFHANGFLSCEEIAPQLRGILIEKQKHQGVEIGIATKLETIIESIQKLRGK